MFAFTSITIIYNPNSTGSGWKLAEALKAELDQSKPKQVVKIIATKYAGHAEKLAYKQAKTSAHPLVISASGDGGYHEVVNGLMRAQNEGAKPIAGLLPAGNANDHFRAVHEGNLAKHIINFKLQKVDLLKLTTKVNSKPFERYAHSYIGVGLTPKVGRELNKTKLNFLNEIGIVINVLFFLRPVRLLINGKKRSYDNLIFSNVGKMAKVLSLSDKSKSNDGKFEVTSFRRRNKIRLIIHLLKASTTGMEAGEQVEKYVFKTTKTTLVQLDGEIFSIDPNTEATVGIEQKILRCVI